MRRAVIIGSGNVAEAFARALPQHGAEVVQIFARNAERGAAVAAIAGCSHTADPQQIAAADIYIAAVSDRAIADVLRPLALPCEAVVVHVSGAQPLDVIPAGFGRRGVLYPLQTFTSGRAVDFDTVPLFVEGVNEDVTQRIEAFARTLSSDVRRADSTRRAQIHLAGVFACNFANAMYAAGCEVVRNAGFSFDVLKPLIVETARKAAECQNPHDVQTGPAVRNDIVSINRHLELLQNNEMYKLNHIYETISDYIKDGKEL